MPTLLLARHAQASFGASDYDALSERGREQVAELAAELVRRGPRIARVVSGSLIRQRDTAKPIAERLGLEVEIDSRWNEYESDHLIARHVAPAVAPASSREHQVVLDEALHAWIADESADGSWPAFRDRVAHALRDLAASLGSGETALVTTSGGPIAATCVELLGLPEEAFVPFNRVTVNAGLTKVVSGRSGTTLVSFNEHLHLERDGASLVTYR